MQVAAKYIRDTNEEEEVMLEPRVRLVRPSRRPNVVGDLKFGLSVLIGSFVLIELATKFH